ncbi:methylamine utilization protein MauE [Sphingobium algorifonticola]|uniref:Methylamine utilization protein MauE n=1 Tax=Sphingobium algorifonticola TaxID=2008318 RepID=A0A437J7Q5_9SPHN|nr:methylamine utilization protein MauE [Sphingobium algorifonticola]
MDTLVATMAMAACTGTGIIFVAAAIGKLRHRDVFPGVVANYRLLDARLVGAVAMLLPVVELIVGFALIANLSGHAAAAAIVLLILFAAAMAINIRRGRTYIDCGCGLSHLRQPLGWSLVGRNLLLAAMLLPATANTVSLTPAAKAVALAAGLAVALIYVLFNAIAAVDAHARLAFGKQI